LPSLCWHVTAINPPPPNPGGRPQPGVRRVRRLPMRGHPRADPHWRDPAHERFSLAESSFSVGPTHPDLGQHRFARGPGLSARGPTPAAWKTADTPYSKSSPLSREIRLGQHAPRRRGGGAGVGEQQVVVIVLACDRHQPHAPEPRRAASTWSTARPPSSHAGSPPRRSKTAGPRTRAIIDRESSFFGRSHTASF
jgi:hypothetical protein